MTGPGEIPGAEQERACSSEGWEMAAKKDCMVQVSQERIRTGTVDNICPSLDMKEIVQRTCAFSCEEGIAAAPTTTVLHLTPDPGGVGNPYRAFQERL